MATNNCIAGCRNPRQFIMRKTTKLVTNRQLAEVRKYHQDRFGPEWLNRTPETAQ
jgi:hypothetical protein